MHRHPFATALAAFSLLLFGVAGGAHGQWLPRGALARIPIVHDCSETGGDAAASRLDPPAVYLCDSLIRFIRRSHPGAEQFFLAHEFGHVVQQTTDESLADCWAARELVRAPDGVRYLRVAIELFRDRPSEHPRYGSAHDRVERIRACAEDERPGAMHRSAER